MQLGRSTTARAGFVVAQHATDTTTSVRGGSGSLACSFVIHCLRAHARTRGGVTRGGCMLEKGKGVKQRGAVFLLPGLGSLPRQYLDTLLPKTPHRPAFCAAPHPNVQRCSRRRPCLAATRACSTQTTCQTRPPRHAGRPTRRCRPTSTTSPSRTPSPSRASSASCRPTTTSARWPR
jgi:hypothetical protein